MYFMTVPFRGAEGAERNAGGWLEPPAALVILDDVVTQWWTLQVRPVGLLAMPLSIASTTSVWPLNDRLR